MRIATRMVKFLRHSSHLREPEGAIPREMLMHVFRGYDETVK